MRPNPFTDLRLPLTSSEWPSVTFWVLVVASLAIAVAVWMRGSEERTAKHLGRYVLRVAMGLMWWQQALWKVLPNFDGLRFWMQQMVDLASIPAQSDLVRNFVLPNIDWFGPVVFGAEVLIAVLLILGVYTRFAALLGAMIAINLWLGLYSAPNEWPWTYGFLVIIQISYIIDPPGRSLGVDRMRRLRWNVQLHGQTAGIVS